MTTKFHSKKFSKGIRIMKIFQINLFDSDPVVITEKLVIDHVEFLTKLYNEGVLIFCGPCFTENRAMILLKANSKQVADDIISQDPFSLKCFYRQRIISEIAECHIENQFFITSIDRFHSCARKKLSDLLY